MKAKYPGIQRLQFNQALFYFLNNCFFFFIVSREKATGANIKFINLQVLGKLWSALPPEEKENYKRKAERQKGEKDKRKIENSNAAHAGRLDVGDMEAEAKPRGNLSDQPIGSYQPNRKAKPLMEVPDPYLIFSSEVRGHIALIFVYQFEGMKQKGLDIY